MKFIIPLLIGVLLLLIFFFASNFFSPTYSLSHIEIAKSPEAREHGLSGRTDIPEDYGMLFVFDEKGDYGFWMNDMETSIDIFWLSDTGTIVEINEEVSPGTYPEVFRSPLPVRYVLETRAGTAKTREWNVGTKLTLPLQ